MAELNLTSSIYSFEQMRETGYLYVDKTEYIWNLIRLDGGMYFLSRPRRFGKSLAVSTLKALFEGKKELFKGLSVYNKPYDWKPYPVIHLSMTGRRFDTLENLQHSLQEILLEQARGLNVALERTDPVTMFQKLIETLSQSGRIVVLLDEYDKPILDNIAEGSTQDFVRAMKSFYSVIKDKARDLRFVFVTGVSKFCHVSLFSDLNNLADITVDSRYATMFGYTQEELERYFGDRIRNAAGKLEMTEAALKEKLKVWYDGFRFAASAEGVYNPVSIARFFERGGEFDNYWFSTGTPSFLMKLARETDFDFERVLDNPVTMDAFSAYEIDKIDPLLLLVQTGYLTIKSSVEDFGMRLYKLDFPNREVASSFRSYLLNAYTPYTTEEVNFNILALARSIRSGDVDAFMNVWKNWMAKIPYDIQLRHEKYYQTIFYMMFTSLQGIINEAECRTNSGRIDAVVGCGEWLYIVEFKLDKSPEVALEQIKKNEYFVRYQNCGKRIVLIGANVDFENRRLTGWKHEEVCGFSRA